MSIVGRLTDARKQANAKKQADTIKESMSSIKRSFAEENIDYPSIIESKTILTLPEGK